MAEENGVERELKFHCADLSSLREKLTEGEADRVSASSREDNLVFDRGGEVAAKGCILRLRRDGKGARLTFKGPPRVDESGARVREERETRLEDPDAVERILEHLGFEVATRYQKDREEWLVGGVTVCLDRTPIGDFAEFEGEGSERLAERFGFPAEESEPRNYLKLYSDYRKENPDAPEDMVFPE